MSLGKQHKSHARVKLAFKMSLKFIVKPGPLIHENLYLYANISTYTFVNAQHFFIGITFEIFNLSYVSFTIITRH